MKKNRFFLYAMLITIITISIMCLFSCKSSKSDLYQMFDKDKKLKGFTSFSLETNQNLFYYKIIKSKNKFQNSKFYSEAKDQTDDFSVKDENNEYEYGESMYNYSKNLLNSSMFDIIVCKFSDYYIYLESQKNGTYIEYRVDYKNTELEKDLIEENTNNFIEKIKKIGNKNSDCLSTFSYCYDDILNNDFIYDLKTVFEIKNNIKKPLEINKTDDEDIFEFKYVDNDKTYLYKVKKENGYNVIIKYEVLPDKVNYIRKIMLK